MKRQLRAQGIDPSAWPAWLRDVPALSPGNVLAYSAWCDCSSDRQIGFGVGPIPWSSLVAWCRLNGVSGADRRYMVALVQAADRQYVERVASRSMS